MKRVLPPLGFVYTEQLLAGHYNHTARIHCASPLNYYHFYNLTEVMQKRLKQLKQAVASTLTL